MTHQLQQCLYWLLLISVYEGNGFLLNVSVNNEGFFLKPIFRGSEIYSLNSLERHFVSNAFYSYHAPSVSLNYGSYSSVHKIPQDVWKAAAKNNSKHLSAVKVVDSDIRVRIVEDAITSEQQELHVVYHAFKQRISQQYASGNVPDTAEKESIPSLLCLVTGVENQHTSVASKCSIGQGENHCITSSNLLQLWHMVGGGSNNVSVWYFVQNVASASQCEDIRQDVESQLRVGYVERAKLEREGLFFLSHLLMVLESPHARRYSIDNKTSFYLVPPQRTLHSGELFSVPVRLQQQLGEWRTFTLRLRARPGVRVVSVESQSKVWQVMASDTAARGDWATVTVKFVGASQASRVDDIVLWRCQVDPETHDSQSRLMMTVHDVTTGGGEGGEAGSKHKKMVLLIDIQRDDVLALVPFIQATDVLNLAVLTGRSVSWPLVVYVVTSAGDIVDVTRDCTCLTSSQQIIKVSKQCQSVYVDGSETSGGDGVTVTVRYRRHEAIVSLLVWYPELPLSVEVSDDRLNLIKGWRVPPKRLIGFGDWSESDRHGDWYEDGEMSTLCEPRYQSTVVEVYARFFVVDEYFSPRYFTDRKALVRLTDTLASQLRVTNDYVVSIHDNIVTGKRPGSADVQVVSGSGVVLGKRTVRVVADRVQVEKLQVQLIGDVQVEYGIERELSSGSIVFRMNPVSKLTKRYQEGMLDVGVYFSDDTTLPLDYFSLSEYQLVAESADRNVVTLSSESSSATPQLVALNPGSGALVKVSLELSKKCQAKKSQALATSHVDVLVDFDEDEQSMASSGRLTEKPLNDAANSYLQSGRYNGEKKTSKKSVARLDDVYARVVDPNYGEAEAQTYEEQDIAGLSPAVKWSSTGMYALLVVFSVATLFFVGNCILFITRCHVRLPAMPSPRRRGEKTTDLQADGWVWLGPETLARNMVNVECSRTLMDERAFNESATGTGSVHGSLPPAYSGSPTTSSRGSAHGSRVSTYKGSECSIRIVSNPLECVGDALAAPASTSAERSYCDWERDDLSAEDVAMEFACDRVSLAESQDLHSSASLKSHKSRASVSSASKAAAAPVAAPAPAVGGLNPTPMDYQELMVYFENLKESIA